ncbi:MAG: DUF1467 family protein [Xanthobacteraceae bacterium]
MAWTTWLAIYFIMWWTLLFAVLPWGVKSHHETGQEVLPGTDPGAPARPRLKSKVLWTTLVTTILFAAFYYATVNGLITLEGLARLLGMPDWV